MAVLRMKPQQKSTFLKLPQIASPSLIPLMLRDTETIRSGVCKHDNVYVYASTVGLQQG